MYCYVLVMVGKQNISSLFQFDQINFYIIDSPASLGKKLSKLIYYVYLF